MGFLDAYMSHDMQNRVIPVLLTALIGLIGRYLSAKPRVVWGVSHQFAFNVGPRTEEATGVIHTRSLIVQNMGRAVAKDINVIFNYKPKPLSIMAASKLFIVG